MNYLELILNFWKLDNAWQFTCCETRLYFYLVETANGLGWVNSWTHSDAKTSANVGVSVNTLKTSRNKLSQAGLISFKEGGKGHGNKTRYQILTPKVQPNLQPKVQPNLQPNLQPLLNKHKQNKTKLNTSPPNPLKGDDEGAGEKDIGKEKEGETWRTSFDTYKSELRKAYKQSLSDTEFLQKMERYHPGIDVKLSLEKACVEYWSLEAGWKKKKSSRSVDIDWPATFTNALNLKSNQVYKRENGAAKEKETEKLSEKGDYLSRFGDYAKNAAVPVNAPPANKPDTGNTDTPESIQLTDDELREAARNAIGNL